MTQISKKVRSNVLHRPREDTSGAARPASVQKISSLSYQGVSMLVKEKLVKEKFILLQ